MALELELFPMPVDACHRAERGLLTAFRGARREDGPGHDAGIEVPRLRHEADPDDEPVGAGGVEERLQLLEGALGIGAGGLEKHLELRLAMAELDRGDGMDFVW